MRQDFSDQEQWRRSLHFVSGITIGEQIGPEHGVSRPDVAGALPLAW